MKKLEILIKKKTKNKVFEQIKDFLTISFIEISLMSDYHVMIMDIYQKRFVALFYF